MHQLHKRVLMLMTWSFPHIDLSKNEVVSVLHGAIQFESAYLYGLCKGGSI